MTMQSSLRNKNSIACISNVMIVVEITNNINYLYYYILYISLYIATKQKQPGCKKVRGQSEATMVISDQNL